MALFTATIFTEGVLPFLLVFVLVFAILQKTKILGEGKAQIDALIALAIGLITIAIPTTRDYIVHMMPWLALALVTLLVFMLIYGFVATGSDPKKGLEMPGWVSKTVLWLGIIFVVLLVLNVTGYIENVKDWFGSDDIVSTVLIVAVIVAALWVALGTGKKGGSSTGS
jgi:hypothetical protein